MPVNEHCQYLIFRQSNGALQRISLIFAPLNVLLTNQYLLMLINVTHSVIKFFTRNSWVAWLCTVVIFIACNWPAKNIPENPFPYFDKIVHTIFFFVWTILWLLLYPEKPILIILIGVFFGLGIEVSQQLLGLGRTFDLWDAAVDAVGILLGFGFKSILLDRYLQRLY